MSIEYDEDVVFEGSQLHKYFQNVGVDSTNYICVSRKPDKIEDLMIAKRQKKPPRNTYTIVSGLKNPFGRNSPSRLETSSCQEYSEIMKRSDVLTEEDAVFLENCLPFKPNKHCDVEFPQQDVYKLFAVVSCLVAYCYCNYFDFELQQARDFLTWTHFFTLLLGLYILNIIRGFWKYFVFKRTHQQNQNSLKTLLDSCSNILKLIQKCILLLQEMELVDRGFTLILPQVSSRNFDSPLRSYRNVCPALRQLTFLSCKKLSLIFREATKKLLNDFRLSSGIEHESHYLAAIPVEEFGFHFSDDLDSFDVDPFTISSLKSTLQLASMQVSEYFRRLCMSLNVELHDSSFRRKNVFWSFMEFITPLQGGLTSILDPLEQSFQFHKNAVLTKANERIGSKERINHQSQFRNATVAIHSLSLHLQSALSRTIDLENELDKEDTYRNALNNSKEEYENLTHLLQSVKMELNACQTCQEESQAQVNTLFNKKPPAPKLSTLMPMGVAEKDSIIINRDNPIPLFEMGDPVTEDQVFEAFISNSGSHSSDNEDDFIAQKEGQKKQKEATKLMLNELQTILTIKAEEWKKREIRALAKARGLDPEKLVDEFIHAEGNHNQKEKRKGGGDIKSSTTKFIEIEDAKSTLKLDKTGLVGCELLDRNFELSEDVREQIKRRLHDNSQASQLSLAASVAALAASRSREMKCIASEIFTDSDVEDLSTGSDP